MNEKRHESILIIDDEAAIRTSFQAFLEDRNYRTITAENGRIGLQLFVIEKPDLVLVDLRMPEVDGLDVLARVKAIAPDTPLIVVSGTGVIADVIEALHLGASDYVLKPVNDLQILLHAIEKALERARLKAQERDYQIRLQQEVERKTSALKKSEQQYRMLAENINDVIWTADMEFQLTYVSPSVTKLFGFDPNQLIGINAIEMLSPESQTTAKQVFAREMRLAREQNYEKTSIIIDLEQLNQSGEKIWTEVQVVLLLDDNKQPTGFLGVSRDTSYRRQLEAHLRQGQKMEAIGTLAGGIAHDFNNILSAILGYAELAQYESSATSGMKKYLHNILKAGNRAKELVARILSFSRQKQKEHRPIRIVPVVKEALQLLRASVPSSIHIDLQVESDNDIVRSDPGDIHQIVMNLCTNAYQAIGNRLGEIHLKLVNKTLTPGHLLTQLNLKPGPYLVLTVRDSGPGMDKETQDKIFTPYYTTKESGEGTGLGLTIVHGIVNELNGMIRVTSEIGSGTAFQVFLPISIEEQQEGQAEQLSAIPGGNEHILYVDDESMLVDIGQNMLARLGYEVSTAVNGLQALELVKEHPKRFDLVVADLNMPIMPGDQLAEELSRVNPELRVILCTGNQKQFEDLPPFETAICGVIQKPLSFSELAHTVRRALDMDKPKTETDPL